MKSGGDSSALQTPSYSLRLSGSAESGGGYISAPNAGNSDALGFVRNGLTLDCPVNDQLSFEAHASLIAGSSPRILAPASDLDGFTRAAGGTVTAARVAELWGQVGYNPTSDLRLRLRGGIIDSRAETDRSGLGESVLWYGRDPTIGDARAPGVRLDARHTLYGGLLTFSGSAGYKTMASPLVASNTNGTPAYDRSDSVVFGSLGADVIGISDWFRFGVQGSVATGFAEQDRFLVSHQTMLASINYNYDILFGGNGHELDTDFRYTVMRNEQDGGSQQVVAGERYQGPLANDVAGAVDIQTIAVVTYMRQWNPDQQPMDPSPQWREAIGEEASIDVSSTTPATEAVELSLKPKFIFHPWVQHDLYVQPVASFLMLRQEADPLQPAFFAGMNMGMSF